MTMSGPSSGPRIPQHSRVEAAVVAGVAGGTDLIDADEQGITVAVDAYLAHVLTGPGRLPLDPVRSTAPAPVRGQPGRECQMQGLIVHPAQHQHLTGVGLTDHRRGPAILSPLQAGCAR